MADYLIKAPHTKEECLRALDETLGKGPDVLAQFEWGCMKGDHTAYGIVRAENVTAARNLVPEIVRNKATIQEVTRISPDQIRQFHQG
jgi:hypothetical protein